jgi:hypothetical protein
MLTNCDIECSPALLIYVYSLIHTFLNSAFQRIHMAANSQDELLFRAIVHLFGLFSARYASTTVHHVARYGRLSTGGPPMGRTAPEAASYVLETF